MLTWKLCNRIHYSDLHCLSFFLIPFRIDETSGYLNRVHFRYSINTGCGECTIKPCWDAETLALKCKAKWGQYPVILNEEALSVKGFIIWPKKELFFPTQARNLEWARYNLYMQTHLACWDSQSEQRIHYIILPI